jgi:hypothetical protein
MMEEGRHPHSNTATRHPKKTQRTSFNPLQLLQKAINYGEDTWYAITKHRESGQILTTLLNLTYIIEEHIQNLVYLCSQSKVNQGQNNYTLQRLQSFYSSPKIFDPQQILRNNLAFQLSHPPEITTGPTSNYYQYLDPFDLDQPIKPQHEAMATQQDNSNNVTSQLPKKSPPTQASYFVEDLGITEISEIVLNQVQKDQMTMEVEEGVESTNLMSPTVYGP